MVKCGTNNIKLLNAYNWFTCNNLELLMKYKPDYCDYLNIHLHNLFHCFLYY